MEPTVELTVEKSTLDEKHRLVNGAADPDGTATVSIERDAFAHYDETGGWTVSGDTNAVPVGRSSRDIRAPIDVEA